MSEKEIVKRSRKPKISAPENAKTAHEKTAPPRKTAAAKASAPEKIVEKTEPDEFIIDSVGELKFAGETKTAKKNLVEMTEKVAFNKSENSAPEASAMTSDLAGAIEVIEELKDDSTAAAKPRKKAAVTKKASAAGKTPIAASSDTSVKKTRAKTKKREAAPIETIVPIIAAERQNDGENQISPEIAAVLSTEKDKKEESAIFRQLAEPRLSPLPQENRARLQVQSPNRIFLYWTTRHNPSETLRRALPTRHENFTLTAKLVNLNDGTEEVFPIGNSGSWWFDVDSNTAYRAEIGFFAAGRPFVRLMSSNTIETPRHAPSPNTDWSTDFVVSADKFAEVLDAAGYAQDSFDVAIAGDDARASDEATRHSVFQITGERHVKGDTSELRYALFALASGAMLETLRGRISRSLFNTLETATRADAEKLSAENVRRALKENFVFEDEGEEFTTPVFGASSINFPKQTKLPKFSPISSIR